MGRLLSKLPTDVHLGKFLLIATLFRCLDPALTIAAALNSKSPFVTPFGLEQEAERAKNSFRVGESLGIIRETTVPLIVARKLGFSDYSQCLCQLETSFRQPGFHTEVL